MLGNKKVLAIIPARGGSKGLPGKNIKILGGKPLIAWTLDAANKSSIIDKTVVSTDCPDIASVARKYGADVPFTRPKELSSDIASSADVVLHAIKNVGEEYGIIVLLQPTSPFRNENDIKNAFEIYSSKVVSSVVSVCKADKSPYWLFWQNDDKSLRAVLNSEDQFIRRQDLQDAYALNGAIYIVGNNCFLENQKFIYDDSLSYVMNKESSVDIDDLLDFKFAQLLLGVK